MNFKYPSRLKFAHLPTPIEKMGKYSQILDGPEIYLKRDDLTGITLTGNKVRKLEFVVAEAMKQGADVLITCGGIQSNHARATAVIATQLGIKSYLVLRGQQTTAIEGNLFLDYLMGADIKFITAEDYQNRVDEIMEEVAEDLRQKGYKPYIIPEGASNELGAVGYIAATEEIIAQLKAANLEINTIICATGSGGTYAGLLMGKKIFEQNYEVVSINVCADEQYFINRIRGILEKAQHRFQLNLGLTKEDIQIIDGYVGKGYALSRPEEIDLIKKVAQIEGIVLDPVYTGKAMFGLTDQIKKGRFKKGEKILFLHSGGIFGLFAQRELFRNTQHSGAA